MEKMANDEIKCKRQIVSLENQNAHSVADSQEKLDTSELSPVMFMCTICGFDLVPLIRIHNKLFHCLQYYAKILKQLNEKAFQLEVWRRSTEPFLFYSLLNTNVTSFSACYEYCLMKLNPLSN